MKSKLYDEYEKFNFMIANPDIFGFEAPAKLKDFIKDNNISSDMINQFDKKMESECRNGNAICKLETLSDIEYITFMAMMGNLSKYWVIEYMNENKLDKIELCNGFTIRQFGKSKLDYVVDFPTEDGYDTMKYELFISLIKARLFNAL